MTTDRPAPPKPSHTPELLVLSLKKAEAHEPSGREACVSISDAWTRTLPMLSSALSASSDQNRMKAGRLRTRLSHAPRIDTATLQQGCKGGPIFHVAAGFVDVDDALLNVSGKDVGHLHHPERPARFVRI
jgi:hypothetical protein